jgi:hypothetical protein
MPVHGGLTFSLADRVEEKTTTTGTGNYGLGGIITPGRRTFAQAFSSGTRTFYTCELPGTTGYEEGLGTYTSAGNTVSRDLVILSSNNNLAVNWGPGDKVIYVDTFAALANQIWARPGGGLPISAIEQRGPFAMSGSQAFLDIGSIASTARIIMLGWSNMAIPTVSGIYARLGDSGGIETTGYASSYNAVIDVAPTVDLVVFADRFVLGAAHGNPNSTHYGSATFTLINTNFWTYMSNNHNGSAGGNTQSSCSGAKLLSAPLTTLRFASSTGANFSAGGTLTAQIIHSIA